MTTRRSVFAIIPRSRPTDPGMAALWDYIRDQMPTNRETRMMFPTELSKVHQDYERCLNVMMQRGYLEYRKATAEELREIGLRSS